MMTEEGGDLALFSSPSTSHPHAPSNRKSLVSSYQVFLNHIVVGEEEVDVSGVFSQECFSEWLATRPGEILHPEQSYQRVLYAHIRAADHRKPFPENVETALLKILRCEHNETENPWSMLFGENVLKVGKKGFRKQGYHEALHSNAAPKPKPRTRKSKRTATKRSSTVSSTSSKPSTSSEIVLSTSPRVKKFAMTMIKNEDDKESHFDSHVHPFLTQLNKYFYSTCDPIESHNTPWDLMMSAYEKYMPMERRKRVLDSAAERGVDVYSPAVYYFLHEEPVKNDLRFDLDFLIPKLEDRKFKDSKPLGELEYNLSGIVSKENAAAIEIFGNSVIGYHAYELKGSILASLFAVIKFMPELMQTNRGWKREFIKKPDGTMIICLCFFEWHSEGHILHFQDVTDQFPEVLKFPYFI